MDNTLIYFLLRSERDQKLILLIPLLIRNIVTKFYIIGSETFCELSIRVTGWTSFLQIIYVNIKIFALT